MANSTIYNEDAKIMDIYNMHKKNPTYIKPKIQEMQEKKYDANVKRL